MGHFNARKVFKIVSLYDVGNYFTSEYVAITVEFGLQIKYLYRSLICTYRKAIFRKTYDEPSLLGRMREKQPHNMVTG